MRNTKNKNRSIADRFLRRIIIFALSVSMMLSTVACGSISGINYQAADNTSFDGGSKNLTRAVSAVLGNDVEAGDSSEDERLSDTQRNSINMLNYMTVLTQEINDSKGSRAYLESAYSSLINNTYPNAVDSRTQSQMTSILDTLESYRMITVKRDRLQFLYDQARAAAIRKAVPDPTSFLSYVLAGNAKKAATAVIYMAVDSASSYKDAVDQADMEFLQDGWGLDDEEAEELHNSRKSAFNYMLSMVRDNNLPGDYALNEDAVQDFVTWKNNTNLVRAIAWFETNEKTYSQFGPYWLELAKCYYDTGDYEKCLEAVSRYETVTSRIFRKDHDYAATLPMAIISSKEIMGEKEYEKAVETLCPLILENTSEEDWTLRYFVATTYLDVYSQTKKQAYLEQAYKIAFDNVNVLVDEQKDLNSAYLADVKEVKADKDATKREKNEVKQYNKLIKAERKTQLPPVHEAFYLNCDLLFTLAKELDIPEKEQKRIDSILHEGGNRIFLTEAQDDRFWFDNTSESLNSDSAEIEYGGDELSIPAVCMTDRSVITVTVTGSNGKTTFDDWTVDKVSRPKKSGVTDFVAELKSKAANKYKFKAGDSVQIRIVPVEETPDKALEATYEVVSEKKLRVFNGISFERKK